jgi:AraC-like DNA-binding protein
MSDAIPVYVHLLRAKDLIDRDYAKQLDVPALARAAHASTAHFSRSFKRAFGETPHRYLLRRRIERAKELLRGTDMSVTEVSVEVGFQSVGSFSATFRDLVGSPPSEYARGWRAAGPPPIPGCFTLMYTRPVESNTRPVEASTQPVESNTPPLESSSSREAGVPGPD